MVPASDDRRIPHVEFRGACGRLAALSPHAITPAEHRREGTPRLRVAIHNPDGIAEARRRVRDLVGIDMTPRRRADALLLVTELITNSLRHVEPGPITVWGWLDAHRLRVEVHDAGPGIPADRPWMLPRERVADGGRGLAMVRMVSDRCGHRAHPSARVWFEIDVTTAGGRH